MRILLVEDDKKLSQAVCYWLKQNHYEADSCYTGDEAMYYISEGSYDCILLDRMLPGKDGITILRSIRQSKNLVPVILITALDSLEDKLTGLDCGADDYLVKPFEFAELEARIRCVTRRSTNNLFTDTVTFGDLSYETDELRLSGPSSSLVLSRKEGQVMEAFLTSQGKTLSREAILAKVWGLDSDIENANLDNYIHFLRRRMRSAGSTMKLSNVWGIGFRLEESGKA